MAMILTVTHHYPELFECFLCLVGEIQFIHPNNSTNSSLIIITVAWCDALKSFSLMTCKKDKRRKQVLNIFVTNAWSWMSNVFKFYVRDAFDFAFL